jgi:hypothetical protein
MRRVYGYYILQRKTTAIFSDLFFLENLPGSQCYGLIWCVGLHGLVSLQSSSSSL